MSGVRYPARTRERARELAQMGLSQYAIADALNVSRDTVRAWIIPARGKRSGNARRYAERAAD